MTIALDISQIVHEGTGVARYTSNLVRAVLDYDTTNSWTFFLMTLRGTLDPALEREIKKKHRLIRIPVPPSVIEPMWNRAHILPIETFVGDVDLVITSDWAEAPTRKASKVTIVHDVVYLKYPETLHPSIVAVQKRRMRWIKEESDLIIADSHSTRDDLIELLHIDEKKIEVVYPAVKVTQPTEADVKRVLAKYQILNTKYLLSVGKLEPRKNIPRLIEAFQKANLQDTELLIVGPEGWGNSKSKALPSPKASEGQANVRFLGYVPDEDLYALYKGARAFVYPSLYEGFGYPVVEAMALGTPVATSDTSSLSELGQHGAILFDPLDINSLAKAVASMAKDDERTSKNVQTALQFARSLSSKYFYEQFETHISRFQTKHL